MKASFRLLVLLTCIITYSYGQESNKTKAENFSTTSGVLMRKQFIDIGSVKGVSVSVVKFKDLSTEKENSLLKFEYKAYSGVIRSSSMDIDEVEGILTAIDNLNKITSTSVFDVYTEAIYKSVTGLKVGAYYDVDKQKWNMFIRIEEYSTDSQVFLSSENLMSLRELIEAAKSKF